VVDGDVHESALDYRTHRAQFFDEWNGIAPDLPIGGEPALGVTPTGEKSQDSAGGAMHCQPSDSLLHGHRTLRSTESSFGYAL